MNSSNVAFKNIAEAFSLKSQVYDEFGKDHVNLTRMREQVYRHVLEYLQPGARILELNAGTGTDAVHFARQGFSVHATDFAPGMVARIEQKIAQQNLQDRMSVQQCSFTDLEQINAAGFDCVFSNFGGLNCIPDLRTVTRHLPHLLCPGGFATWVIMPPFCLWDLTAILKGDLRTATRRWSRHGTLASVEGVRFMTYYFTPRQVAAAFGSAFELVRVQGLSVLTPPADRKSFAARFPRLFRVLVSLDEKIIDRRPLREWGDLFIITMRYTPRDSS